MEEILNRLTESMTDYQAIPFWSWNDKLEPNELKRQIRWMKNMGIGGFFMHARGGLKTPYLSEEWMQCINACCEEAQRQGMHAWAYDENGWPSGFVGGKLLEDVENRDRYILKEIGKYDASADVSYLLTEEHLVRVTDGDAEGTYLNLYIRTSASTVDILSPDVVDQFIENTHEQYKKYLGDSFSEKLKGFFTDEPQYYRWNTAFSPTLVAFFEEQYQEDIFDKLGLLFVKKEGYREFRYRYWLAMQRLMLTNFSKKIFDWCDKHDIQFTGHYIEETSIGFQTTCCGGVMPFYEYMHIPGIDWLGRDTTSELSPRQLGSVARQLGKKHALTETFAACGWDVSPAQLRRIAGFQYANGANLMCQHLIPYSECGQRKGDHPAHFSPMNPWIQEEFQAFNDYFTRLGYLLSTGEEPVNVAILHPIRSTYFEYQREEGEQGGEAVQKLDQHLKEVCRMFSSRAIAYHFLDETLMETHGFVHGNQIGCGNCSYDYLIIPQMLTMGKTTEHFLQEYVNNGGKVLLLYAAPKYLEGTPYEYTYLKSNCTLQEIIEAQPLKVEKLDNELYYAYRNVDGIPFLFVQNASDTESYTQEFSFADCSCSFTKLDPVSMKTEKLPLTFTIRENESLLLFPTDEEYSNAKELQEVDFTFENAEVDFDTNYLTVDVVQYSKDGVHYSEPMLCSALFQQLLKEQYVGKLWLKYNFHIETMPEKVTLMAEKGNACCGHVNGQRVLFAECDENERNFCFADITDALRLGLNSYETVLNWYQRDETYYALFGENVTETLKNCIVYESEIEAIYLSGKFGVYSKHGFVPHDAETVCAHDFLVGEIPTKVNELTTDGFPFFKGRIRLSQNITLHTKDTLLRLKGRYLTAKVWVNEEEAGKVLFDRWIDVSPCAKDGENKIEVEFLIGNRNFMGPFHSEGPETLISPTRFEQCDLHENKDGNIWYRFCVERTCYEK